MDEHDECAECNQLPRVEEDLSECAQRHFACENEAPHFFTCIYIFFFFLSTFCHLTKIEDYCKHMCSVSSSLFIHKTHVTCRQHLSVHFYIHPDNPLKKDNQRMSLLLFQCARGERKKIKLTERENEATFFYPLRSIQSLFFVIAVLCVRMYERKSGCVMTMHGLMIMIVHSVQI